MPLTIETDLKDIFNKIDQRLERMEQGQNELKLSVSELSSEIKGINTELKGEIKGLDTGIKSLNTELKGEIKSLSSEVKGDIKGLDIKVDGLSKRVDNQEFLLRGIFGGLLLIILGGAAKMFSIFPTSS
jgi:chromosome segregation ATPase